MKFSVEPIGFVRGARRQPEDDFWGQQHSRIELVDALPIDSLRGLDDFSHAEVIFVFHAVDPAEIVSGARHPRGNPAWPSVGIFAQRGKNRPNRIGSTICRIERVGNRAVYVSELDAIDGTPVLDIKPVMQEFLPRHEVHQPQWSRELMRDYWLDGQSAVGSDLRSSD
jgi:tRNA-Thr(GGU) m(6)t(6)A37 methyltransferase TsaA